MSCADEAWRLRAMTSIRMDPKTFAVGRPSAELDRHVADALIDATVSLLHDKPRGEITVREIAAVAGVNKAMIGYYFQNKDNLFLALVDHLLKRLSDAFCIIEKSIEKIDLQERNPTRIIIESIIETYSEHSVGLRLLITEIQFNSQLKQLYVEQLCSRPTRVLKRIIGRLVTLGYYRADLDPNFTTFTIEILLCQLIMNENVMEPAFGFSPGRETTQKWVDYLVEIFDRGFRPIAALGN